MPEDRPLKSRKKRAAKSAAISRMPQVRYSVAFQIAFRLPDWEQLPSTLPEESLERRLWDRLGIVIHQACSNRHIMSFGMLVLDFDIPCDPDSAEGFPAKSEDDLAERISNGIPTFPAAGIDQPFPIPVGNFPDCGEVKVSGKFTPEVADKEQLAEPSELVHSGEKDATDEAEIIVSEGPPELFPPPASPEFPTPAAALHSLAPSFPKSYEQLIAALAPVNLDYQQELAALIAPALNAHIRINIPHGDLEGKKKVADFVNSELERFGLAVKCPKTGLPAKLRGEIGDGTGSGSFQFQIHKDGKRVRTVTTNDLPELELIDAIPPREPETPWQDKVGTKSSRRGRKLS